LFNSWSKELLPDIELYLVNIPGRDARIREEPYRELKRLVIQLTEGILPHLDKPFVFFGHSMGSLISFEVVRELRRLGRAQPLRLFVSGRQPPHFPDTHPDFHRLPEEEFLKTTQHFYGALPEIILQDTELMKLFLSMMRADITMIETYEYEHDAPLDCPITAYGGFMDPSVDEQSLSAWHEQTTGGFRMKMFPGEHFFIQTVRSALIQDINVELSRFLEQMGRKTMS
jgi:medium-chain acyl-[acyl-carrier-protein] hydrolase